VRTRVIQTALDPGAAPSSVRKAGESSDELRGSIDRSIGHKALPAMAILLTGIAYIASVGFEFVYDDRVQIMENRLLHSWRYIPAYFTDHVWAYSNPGSLGNFYRPLALLWKLANYEAFGLNPAGWHATTVAIHLLVTLMVYLLARRLTGNVTAAGISSIIFGLHPVHIEAVAWVSGVTDPLLTLILIGSFLCFLRSREAWIDHKDRRKRWLAASLLLYGLATLTKVTALVMPGLIFAYCWLFFEAGLETDPNKAHRSSMPDRLLYVVRSLWPYLAVTAAYLVVRITALKGFSHSATPLPISTVIYTWPSLLLLYIKLLVYPFGLSAFYDTPYVSSPGLWSCILPALLVLAAGTGLRSATRRSKLGQFLLVWLALPIIPVLKLSALPEGQFAHDRFLYLPSVGFCILAGLAISKLKTAFESRLASPALQFSVLVIVTGLLGAGTALQTGNWASNLLLFSRGVKIAPNNNYAVDGLAMALFRRGDIDSAIGLDNLIVQRSPSFWHAHYSLGYFFFDTGNLDEAQRSLERAIEIRPAEATQYCFLGLVLLESGRVDQAEQSIRHAMDLSPEWVTFHYALAEVYLAEGNVNAAQDELQLELASHPEESGARDALKEIEIWRAKGGPVPKPKLPALSSTSEVSLGKS
jgi:tetratricopeptide (TPR) repeat protein